VVAVLSSPPERYQEESRPERGGWTEDIVVTTQKTEEVIDPVQTESVCGTLPVLEQLLAEAALVNSEASLGRAQVEDIEIMEEEEEHFSSAFINKPELSDNEDEPFVIREDLEDRDDIASAKDNEVEEEKGEKEDREVFPPTRPEGDADIIKEIKIAERVYESSRQGDEEEEAAVAEKKGPDTSEDDLDFQPAVSRRNKKKQKQRQDQQSRRASGASFADSESSLGDVNGEDEPSATAAADDDEGNNNVDTCPAGTNNNNNNNKQEGWSFEAEDDLEVNLLLNKSVESVEAAASTGEEKTCLDEVFKFDSELAAAARRGSADSASCGDGEKLVAVTGKETDGWNDLDDAFSAEDEDNNEAAKMTSLNVKMGSISSLDQGVAGGGHTSESENETEVRQRKGASTGVTTESESSVGNSPEVRKTSKKSKKSKKKRF